MGHQWAFSQGLRLSGVVREELSKEPLPGVFIRIGQSNKYFTSDNFGRFSIELDESSENNLIISFPGFYTKEIPIKGLKKGFQVIYISPIELKEVVVESKRTIDRKSSNVVTFTRPDLLQLPSIKPETDIIEVLIKQPGVQPGLEGSVRFSVRGGQTDQNLILLDGIPVYNIGHLANFISVFDPYAIQSMTFFKGGFPSRLGGRAASVLEIQTKEGDKSKMKGEVVLSPLYSKISLEGPIIKGRTSYMASFRKSMVDPVIHIAHAFFKPENRFLYGFYDFNFRLSHEINEKSSIHFSTYLGRDRLKLDNQRSQGSLADSSRRANYLHQHNEWGTKTYSINFRSTILPKVKYSAILAYSDFNYRMTYSDSSAINEQRQNFEFFQYQNAVRDIIVKNDFSITLNNQHSLNLGLDWIYHQFVPIQWERTIENLGRARLATNELARLSATESFGYFQWNYRSTNNLLMAQAGSRIGIYHLHNINKSYPLIEPRLQVTFMLENHDLILEYSRMTQSVHSLNSAGLSLLPDIWVPSTEILSPTISDQVSIMLNSYLEEKDISIQSGIYFKQFQNIIQFLGTSGFAISQGKWDEQVYSGGSGYAYGLEVAVQKKYENVDIDLNYTYSRAFNSFPSINNGEAFPHNFDRPHNVNLNVLWNINSKNSMAFSWAYQSGMPVTLGQRRIPSINEHSFYYPNGTTVHDFIPKGEETNEMLFNPIVINNSFFEPGLILDDVNNFRMEDFHRLDVSYTQSKIWKNGWKRSVGISIYNLYNRQNPYFVFSRFVNNEMNYYKVTLFPILPSFSYGVRF